MYNMILEKRLNGAPIGYEYDKLLQIPFSALYYFVSMSFYLLDMKKFFLAHYRNGFGWWGYICRMIVEMVSMDI